VSLLSVPINLKPCNALGISGELVETPPHISLTYFEPPLTNALKINSELISGARAQTGQAIKGSQPWQTRT
jgi:hypothetical protein